MFDINSFDFSSMTKTADPFAKKSYKDERFYTLPKDEKGNGVAVISFLPDRNMKTLIRMKKINATLVDGGKKQFVNEWSPSTIGKPCPFQELSSRLYASGDSKSASTFNTKERYICNIKVIKDPKNPSNEGKIFLYDMSSQFTEKLKNVLTPSQDSLSLGVKPKEIFNPFKGYVMHLICNKSSADAIPSYDNSEFTEIGTNMCIYGATDEAHLQETVAKAKADLENTYDLSEFEKESAYKSYDELYDKLQSIWGGMYGIPKKNNGTNNVNVAQPSISISSEVQTPTVETVTPNVNIAPSVNTQPTQPTPQATSIDDVDSLLGLNL